jgi:zinc protease
MRQQVLTGIRESEQDTGSMASLAFQELLYPEGHPYRIRTSGTTESIQGLTRDDLAAYHARHVGPTATTIALVGGIASLEDAIDRLSRAFGDWTNEIPEPTDAPPVDPLSETSRATRVIRGKSQADISIGFPTLPRKHEDYYALQVANLILGQLGLMGRLGAEVRDKNGLAYYATSSLSGGISNSLWSARAGVDPSNIGRAIEGIDQELRRIRTEPVTDDEFNDAKSYLIGSLPLGLESLGGVTDLLLTLERFGLGLDYLDRYPEIIRSLTKDDLLRAMATHVDPDRLAIGIAGPEEIEQFA